MSTVKISRKMGRKIIKRQGRAGQARKKFKIEEYLVVNWNRW